MVELIIIWIGLWLIFVMCYLIALLFAFVKKWWLGGIVGFIFAQLILFKLECDVFSSEATTFFDYRFKSIIILNTALSIILIYHFLLSQLLLSVKRKRGNNVDLLEVSEISRDCMVQFLVFL